MVIVNEFHLLLIYWRSLRIVVGHGDMVIWKQMFKNTCLQIPPTLDSWAVHRTHFNFGIVLFFLFLLLLLCLKGLSQARTRDDTWLYYNKGYFNAMSTPAPMAPLVKQAVAKIQQRKYHAMETFPNVWTQVFFAIFYHFTEANTRLGCLRPLLGFTMLLSLSCQRHVVWTKIWKSVSCQTSQHFTMLLFTLLQDVSWSWFWGVFGTS